MVVTGHFGKTEIQRSHAKYTCSSDRETKKSGLAKWGEYERGYDKINGEQTDGFEMNTHADGSNHVHSFFSAKSDALPLGCRRRCQLITAKTKPRRVQTLLDRPNTRTKRRGGLAKQSKSTKNEKERLQAGWSPSLPPPHPSPACTPPPRLPSIPGYRLPPPPGRALAPFPARLSMKPLYYNT